MSVLSSRALAALLAVGIAGACPSRAQEAAPAVSAERAAALGGAVIRILPNEFGATWFFKSWPNIKLARLEDPASAAGYLLRSNLDASSRSGFYAGLLPPGHYKLVQIYGYSCSYAGKSCGTYSIEVNEHFSRFEVRPDQLTDLGAVVVTPEQFLTHKLQLTHDVDPDHAAVTEMVRELTPVLGTLLNHDRPILGWDASTVPRGMDRAQAAVRERSFGFVSPVEAGGHVLYGTANGVLVDWMPGGEHAMRDVGVRSSIEGIAVGADGTWVAGGEFGSVVLSDDQGWHWRSIRGDLPFGLVADLHEWHGQIIATVLRGRKVDIESLDLHDVAAPRWTRVALYVLDQDHYWDAPATRPETTLAGDKLVTLLPPKQVAVFDLQTRNAAINALPDKPVWLDAGPDGALRLRGPSGMFSTGAFESHDLGKTWTARSDLAAMERPAFRDALHGVSFIAGSGPLDGNPPDRRFVYTEDGKTWKDGEHTNIVFTRFFYGRDGTPYASTQDNVVWRSLDGGRTWNKIA